MLIAKGRIDAGRDAVLFMEATIQSRSVRVLPITPEIASLAGVTPGQVVLFVRGLLAGARDEQAS